MASKWETIVKWLRRLVIAVCLCCAGWYIQPRTFATLDQSAAFQSTSKWVFLGCLYLFVGYRALAEYVVCRKRGTATPKDAGIDGRSRAVIIVVYAAMALLIGGSMAWLSAVQPEADAEISVIKRFWELEEYVHLGWIPVVALGTVVIEWVQKRARRGQG